MSAARVVLLAAAAALAACGRDDPPPAAPPPSSSAATPAASSPGGPNDKTPGSPQATTPPALEQPMTGTQPSPAQGPQAAAPGNPLAGTPAAAQGAAAAVPPDQTATPAGSASDPRTFLIAAASAGQFELAASRLAQERASNAAVKAFAERMIADHGKANEELKALAATKNVTLTDEMQAAHQADLDTLSRLQGAAFDQAYAQRVGVQSHMNAVTLFEQASAQMQDPEVKAFAARMLPTLREHLAQAQKLNQDVATRS